MEPWLLLTLLGAVVVILLLVGASVKPLRLIGQVGVRLIVGALLLFLLNSFTVMTGLFVPINGVTASVVAFLGLPGMLLLIAVQHFIL